MLKFVHPDAAVSGKKRLTPSRTVKLDDQPVAHIFPIATGSERSLSDHLSGPLGYAAKDPSLEKLTRCWRVDLDTPTFRRVERVLMNDSHSILVPIMRAYYLEFPTKGEAVKWVKANLDGWLEVNKQHIDFLLEFAEKRLMAFYQSPRANRGVDK